MSVDVLADAMRYGVSRERYAELLPAVSRCLAECDCTTVDRVAMWMSQVGHESFGLLYMEEIASGADYEGRADLGNVYPGDGCRYKGRGPIMVTGRDNYTRCSQWAYDQGLVPTPTYFVDDPGELAGDVYGFHGVTWYWVTQRPMNDAADQRDLVQATKYVNGGTHGIDDRRDRYNHCLGMGQRLLELLAPVPVEMAPTLRGEVALDWDKSLTGQETGWSCGPASAQIILSIRGLYVDEMQLVSECGTHTGGTDTIKLIENVLDTRLPFADYTYVDLPNDPPLPSQEDAMWRHIVHAVDGGFGIIANWISPQGNHPVGIKGSGSPNYRGTIWHYISIVGYDDTYPGGAVRIADSGFQPAEYWITLKQCALLTAGKGYIYPANVDSVAAPSPVPQPTPGVPVTNTPIYDATYQELMGDAPHHAVTFWSGSPWEATASSLQDKTSRLAWEWLRAHRSYDIGRPGISEDEKAWVGPFDALARVLYESTVWLQPLSEDELQAKFSSPDTVAGYARDAVSWLKVVSDKLDTLLFQNQSPPSNVPPNAPPGMPPFRPPSGRPYNAPGALNQPGYPGGDTRGDTLILPGRPAHLSYERR